MCCNNFFHKNTVGESEASSLFQKEKRRPAKSDVSKCYFQTQEKSLTGNNMEAILHINSLNTRFNG